MVFPHRYILRQKHFIFSTWNYYRITWSWDYFEDFWEIILLVYTEWDVLQPCWSTVLYSKGGNGSGLILACLVLKEKSEVWLGLYLNPYVISSQTGSVLSFKLFKIKVKLQYKWYCLPKLIDSANFFSSISILLQELADIYLLSNVLILQHKYVYIGSRSFPLCAPSSVYL